MKKKFLRPRISFLEILRGGGGCIVFIFLSFLRFGSIGREGTGSSGEIARLPGNSISSSANLITGSDTGNWGGV